MKKLTKLLTALLCTVPTIFANAQDNSIRDGGKYYLYNTYYNRVLGVNENNDGFALSTFGTKAATDYVFVATASTLDDGYYWLNIDGTTNYMQASNAEGNTWSIWKAGSLNKEYNSYEWKPASGTEGYIKSMRGEKIHSASKCYVGVDEGKEANAYISVYYNKELNEKSRWQLLDATYPLEVSRLKLYTDELDEAIATGERVYDSPLYGKPDELAIALYNARSARETASLEHVDSMVIARKALIASYTNAMEGNYTTWISGSSLGTNTAFTLGLRHVTFQKDYIDTEVMMLIRNTKGTGAQVYLTKNSMRIGDTTVESDTTVNNWQLAFDGSNITIYCNDKELGKAVQEKIPAMTAVGTSAEWTIFGEKALKTFAPEIVSYNYAYAPGEFYQENGKSKCTAIKVVGAKIKLTEPMDYHILADKNAVGTASTIDLANEDAWVIFDNVRPSDVISNYLKYVKIKNLTSNQSTNCRVAIYLQGAVVYPFKESNTALYGYSGQQFTGEEYKLKLGTNSNMGAAENNIQSFILKRGYMVCFSTENNGKGYSRVYVADHQDKKIEALPAELSGRISRAYIRKWNWVSKKGWCNTKATSSINTEGKLVGSTWFYTWGADRSTQTDMEYIPIKQHIYWPSYKDINQPNSTACLGINEPDHSEQHNNCDCKGVIDSWKATTMMPDFLESGMRIGSPAPTNESWLYDFIGHVNDMAYRCDFVAFHCYWGTNEAANSDAWWSKLSNMYNKTKRPIWITEWNNGASWTTEKWPSSYSDQLTYQKNKIKEILSTLDNADFVERYAFYNWDGGMPRYALQWDSNKNNWWVTPCGEVYRDTHPGHAYKEKMQYIPHYWWPKFKTDCSIALEFAATGNKFNLSVTNPNGDITATETLEYKDAATGTWKTLIENPHPRRLFDTLADRKAAVSVFDCENAAFDAADITVRLKITGVKGGEATTTPITVTIPDNIRNAVVGINGTNAVAGHAVIYNLAGDKVFEGECSDPASLGLPTGTYIINGKKQIIK